MRTYGVEYESIVFEDGPEFESRFFSFYDLKQINFGLVQLESQCPVLTSHCGQRNGLGLWSDLVVLSLVMKLPWRIGRGKLYLHHKRKKTGGSFKKG